MSEIIYEPETLLKTPCEKKIIYFFATWCGPCKMMAPIFEEVVIENKNKSIIFGKVDVEKYKKFAGENNVQSIPTIIMFDNQQHEIKRSQGYLSKNNLLKFILANES